VALDLRPREAETRSIALPKQISACIQEVHVGSVCRFELLPIYGFGRIWISGRIFENLIW